MKDEHTYQLDLAGANFYEYNFVPTIFKNWADVLLDRVAIGMSDSVLDVGCGTGIIARQAVLRGFNPANLYGLDVNQGMIQVAKGIAPEINWILSSVDEIPTEDNFFDTLICQFGYMFFKNKVDALNEMLRVKKIDGKIILGIWNSIDENEGYADLLRIVEESGKSELTDVLKSPFNLGNKNEISSIIEQSNMRNYQIETVSSEVQFPSIKYWIDCDIKASPIAKTISEDQYEQLLSQGEKELTKYVDKDGIVKFNMSAHLVSIF